MLRSDKFGYGFLLLGAPIAYFAGGGPIGAALSGIVGFGFLVAGHLDRSETDPDSLISLGLERDDGVFGQKSSSGDEGTLNIKCAAVKSASVVLQPHIASEEERGLFSFYALFRNDPLGFKPLYISELKAHIIVSKDGKEICSGFGAWINRAENHISLSVGDEARLLLVALSGEKAEAYAVTNSRKYALPTNFRALQRAMSEPSIETHVLTDDRLKLSVTLIDRNGERRGSFVFDYQWTDGNVTVTLQS